MKKLIELLDTIKTNVLKLGSQHKSGQHTLIQDALNAIREARQVTKESNECRNCGYVDAPCPVCGKIDHINCSG